MADLPALVTPEDVADFPGAPFPDAVLEAACAQVRRIAGWHIAPSITETVVVDHDGSGVLHLRSLHVTDVVAVRDLSGSTPRALTGWRWSADGMLSGSFPDGFRVLEVEYVHGYDECPADLLPVIADRTTRRVIQESIGGRSVAYSPDGDRGVEATLAAYRLGALP